MQQNQKETLSTIRRKHPAESGETCRMNNTPNLQIVVDPENLVPRKYQDSKKVFS